MPYREIYQDFTAAERLDGVTVMGQSNMSIHVWTNTSAKARKPSVRITGKGVFAAIEYGELKLCREPEDYELPWQEVTNNLTGGRSGTCSVELIGANRKLGYIAALGNTCVALTAVGMRVDTIEVDGKGYRGVSWKQGLSLKHIQSDRVAAHLQGGLFEVEDTQVKIGQGLVVMHGVELAMDADSAGFMVQAAATVCPDGPRSLWCYDSIFNR